MLFRPSCPATLCAGLYLQHLLPGYPPRYALASFKRRPRDGLWAAQALVPGDSLRDLSLVACLLGAGLVRGGLGELEPQDRTTPGYLRISYETMQARLEGLRLSLGLSLLGVVITTAGSLHRCAAQLPFSPRAFTGAG